MSLWKEVPALTEFLCVKISASGTSLSLLFPYLYQKNKINIFITMLFKKYYFELKGLVAIID
jgi:hypothetical protein